MNAYKEFKQLLLEDLQARYPNGRYHDSLLGKWNDKNANGLTKMIIRWCELKGYQAERVSVTGRAIDRTKTVTNVVGQRVLIGSVEWIPPSMTRGTADISATIRGRSVKIEVKVGKDRQRPAQIEYQKDVERAGGIYLIAHDFQQIVEDITSLNL